MTVIRELLVEQLRGLLDAEVQLTEALPKMVQAAHNPKLKEIIEKHRLQTEDHVERLNMALQMLQYDGDAKSCPGMKGLIEEGQQIVIEMANKDSYASDLALISAAQKVEHFEISAYGTARTLARQLKEMDVARLLSHSLGEEEGADFLLTQVAEPLLQQATLNDLGATTNLGMVNAMPSRQPSLQESAH